MTRPWVLVAVLLGLAQSAFADAPETSLRPMPRQSDSVTAPPAVREATGSVTTAEPGLKSVRPQMRPETLNVSAARPADTAMALTAVVAPSSGVSSLRPAKRPEGFVERASAPAAESIAAPERKRRQTQSRRGSVCGDPQIAGEVIAPITGSVQGCGVPEPVRVTAVAGVRLNQPATIDCDTARALRKWVERGLQPAYGRNTVVELHIAGHYVCRTRNHRKGAKISEHGRGRAIDISGFTFSNGKSVKVAQNYDRKMRKAHKAACGIFTTTLGPGSDGMHEDHLHFDTAKHRNGAYCR